MASILGGHPSGIAEAMFKTSPGSFVGLFPAGSAATEGNPKSGKATTKAKTTEKTTANNYSCHGIS